MSLNDLMVKSLISVLAPVFLPRNVQPLQGWAELVTCPFAVTQAYSSSSQALEAPVLQKTILYENTHIYPLTAEI